MAILGLIFTWWNGATIGTRLGLRGKRGVGEDALGNLYFEGGADMHGRPRRWVIYNGANDASRVTPEWHGWLHHMVEDVPSRALPPRRAWEQPAKANSTGTRQAHVPAGALEAGGRRAHATGDYEPWSPGE